MQKLLLTLVAALTLGAVHAQTLPLRQATASQTVLIGPFLDPADGTAETGLTIDAADVRVSVNGGNIVGKTSGGCTHDELGMYACTFDATDTATVGRFQVTVAETGAVVVRQNFVVVEEAVYDRDFAASATGIVGTAQTGDSFARLGAPAGASIAADLVVIDNFTDDLETRLGTPSNLGGGATVAGNLSDIEGQTDDIGTAGAGLTVLATAAALATVDDFVDTEVAALVTAIGTAGAGLSAIPDQTINLTGTWTGNVTGSVGSVTAVSTGAITNGSFACTGGSFLILGVLDCGTAASLGSTATSLRSAAAFADDTVIGATLVVEGSTQGYAQSRAVTDNALTSDVMTTDAFTVTPSGTGTYYLFGTAPTSSAAATDVNVVSISGDTTAADNLELFMDGTGYAGGTTKLGVNAVQVGSQTASAAGTVTFPGTIASTTNITAGTITTATNVTTVNGLAANVLTAASAAADLTTELQSGLATAAALATVDDYVDTEVAGIQTYLTNNLGALGANATAADDAVMTRLGTPAGASVSADVAAVKSDSAAILTDTAEIGVAGAGLTAISASVNVADFFDTDSGETAGTAVAGSVVYEVGQLAASGGLTAADIVDEFETQSQADPTGFHVNVMEIGGTAQTANDNGADINAILVDTGTTLDGAIGTIGTNVDAILVDTGTTLQAEIDGVQADTEDLQARTPAALVGGRMDSSVGAMANDVQTAASTAADYRTEIQDADVESVNGVTITGDGSGTPFNVVTFRQFKRAFPDAQITRALFREMRDQAVRDFAKEHRYIEAAAR